MPESMTIAKVTGTVVSTNKDEKLTGMKMLIVQPMDIAKMRVKGEMAVAIDVVGACEGEIVMLVSGSSSRRTVITDGKPVDMTIVAIIDHIDIGDKRVFEKYSSTGNVNTSKRK